MDAHSVVWRVISIKRLSLPCLSCTFVSLSHWLRVTAPVLYLIAFFHNPFPSYSSTYLFNTFFFFLTRLSETVGLALVYTVSCSVCAGKCRSLSWTWGGWAVIENGWLMHADHTQSFLAFSLLSPILCPISSLAFYILRVLCRLYSLSLAGFSHDALPLGRKFNRNV